MTKRFILSENDRIHPSILEGARKIYELVSKTLGPRGKTMVLGHPQQTISTKDGVTVAKFIELEDEFENVAAQILRQASEQTNIESGDGTTTSIVLAWAILRRANEYLMNGLSSNSLKLEIEKIVSNVEEKLDKLSTPLKSEQDILNVATISANGDKAIAKMILDAVVKTGKDGIVSIDKSSTNQTTLDIVDGFRIDSGYTSPRFINKERLALCKHDKPIFFVSDFRFTKLDELLPVMRYADRFARPLIIIADEVAEEALAGLIYNSELQRVEKIGMKVCSVKAPRYGHERKEILRDLAVNVGAHFWSSEISTIEDLAEKFEPTHFGEAKTIEIGKYFTSILGGKGETEEVEKRIEGIRAELKQTTDLNECEKLQERISRLASGAAIIRVGGSTDIEVIEKTHRYEDALEALKSAQEEGILPGGGVVLAKISESLKPAKNPTRIQLAAAEIMKYALLQPFLKLAENAGENGELQLYKLLERKNDQDGIDFRDMTIGDMYKLGVIDPTKVVKCALKNAASVANALIMTGGIIVEKL